MKKITSLLLLGVFGLTGCAQNVSPQVAGVGSENGKNRTLSRSSALTHSVEHVPVP